MYAVCAALHAIPVAFVLVGVLLAAGIMFGGLTAWRALLRLAAPLRKAPRWAQVLCAAVFGFYWALSICPPRDADVMRYHLAHIRQIAFEGSWQPLPDYHYALPFGWTLNYLPFEQLGIPQGAHLLNLALWTIASALIYQTLARYSGGPAPLLVTCALLFFPQLLKMGTTAYADVYLIFVVLTVVLLLTKPGGAGLLGFAAWIGAQSRYQAIGIGLAVTAVVLLRRRQLCGRFVLGALAAAVLKFAFLYQQRNRVRQPGMASHGDGSSQLSRSGGQRRECGADRVIPIPAPCHLEPSDRGEHLPGPLLAVSLLAVSLLAAAAFKRTRPVSKVILLLAIMLAVWTITQPRLYSRFSLMLVPMVAIGWAPLLDRCMRGRSRPAIVAGLVLLIGGFVAIDAVYSADSGHYLRTGDLKKFHEATWFYDVFDWVKGSTPPQARFMVVVESSQTYYLERPYRRTDPCLSGIVDWPALETPQQLAALLERGGYDYVLYHDIDWSPCPGGRHMSDLVKRAVEAKVLRVAREFQVRLVTLRIRNESMPGRVLMLQRNRE